MNIVMNGLFNVRMLGASLPVMLAIVLAIAPATRIQERQMVDPHLLAARMVLLTLQASLGIDTRHVSGFRVTTAAGALSFDEAAEYLVSLPKPAQCGAAHTDSGLVDLSCGPVEPTHAWRLRIGRQQLQDRDFVGPVPRACLQAPEACRILVLSGSTETAATPQAFQVMLTDYVITNLYGLSGDEPGASELGRGFDWVVRLHPGGTPVPDRATTDEIGPAPGDSARTSLP